MDLPSYRDREELPPDISGGASDKSADRSTIEVDVLVRPRGVMAMLSRHKRKSGCFAFVLALLLVGGYLVIIAMQEPSAYFRSVDVFFEGTEGSSSIAALRVETVLEVEGPSKYISMEVGDVLCQASIIARHWDDVKTKSVMFTIEPDSKTTMRMGMGGPLVHHLSLDLSVHLPTFRELYNRRWAYDKHVVNLACSFKVAAVCSFSDSRLELGTHSYETQFKLENAENSNEGEGEGAGEEDRWNFRYEYAKKMFETWADVLPTLVLDHVTASHFIVSHRMPHVAKRSPVVGSDSPRPAIDLRHRCGLL